MWSEKTAWGRAAAKAAGQANADKATEKVADRNLTAAPPRRK
jgi:hypothetical protein